MVLLWVWFVQVKNPKNNSVKFVTKEVKLFHKKMVLGYFYDSYTFCVDSRYEKISHSVVEKV